MSHTEKLSPRSSASRRSNAVCSYPPQGGLLGLCEAVQDGDERRCMHESRRPDLLLYLRARDAAGDCGLSVHTQLKGATDRKHPAKRAPNRGAVMSRVDFFVREIEIANEDACAERRERPPRHDAGGETGESAVKRGPMGERRQSPSARASPLETWRQYPRTGVSRRAARERTRGIPGSTGARKRVRHEVLSRRGGERMSNPFKSSLSRTRA